MKRNHHTRYGPAWFALAGGLVAFLLGLLSLASFGWAQQPPMTGTAWPVYGPLDQAAREFGNGIGCRAITVALAQGGQLLYSRGFGWQDASRQQATQPETVMRIASVTKVFTAAAIRKLVREQRLSLDARPFVALGIEPPPGVTPDPRLGQITIAHLLDHRGGWDRKQSFDPMFCTRQVEQYLQLRSAAQPTDVIRFMLAQPLQFWPGQRIAYSNFGYCVLGRVIEKVTGMPYDAYIQQALCQPLGITVVQRARNLAQDRPPQEVWYPVSDVVVEVMDSHGGLIASAPALCVFLEHYWINGEPRGAGQRGDWTFFGTLPGTTAMVRQRTDGYNLAVLCNGRRERSYDDDNEALKRMFDQALNMLPRTRTRSRR